MFFIFDFIELNEKSHNLHYSKVQSKLKEFINVLMKYFLKILNYKSFKASAKF
jgi:hypothetical protein